MKRNNRTFKFFAYLLLIILTAMSILPFWIMFVNATRSTFEIQQHAISLIPSTFLKSNWTAISGKSFNPFRGFVNSAIISTGCTLCTVYFSTLTAYAVVAYRWKGRDAFFAFVMAIMMIPTQVTMIGFYKMCYKLGLTNTFIPLILPAIAAPSTVFFMRQYMLPNLPMEILESARVDGSSEVRTFNQIVIPMVKPAMATQAIFCFVNSWNRLFEPMILLTDKEMYTMPIMVSLLKGDAYKTEYGAIYLALSLSVLPLFIVYFALSKYIIAGVALGGVKG